MHGFGQTWGLAISLKFNDFHYLGSSPDDGNCSLVESCVHYWTVQETDQWVEFMPEQTAA